MAIFAEARQHTDNTVVTKLLTTLSENPETTQRDLATEMGISLGMVVSYIKSCVRKGLVRAKQVAPRRWAYFVTPQGFAEKSAMVSDYLHRSMAFFRDTRVQLEELFTECASNGINKVAMVGNSDVAEIAKLVASSLAIELELVEPAESIEIKNLIKRLNQDKNFIEQLNHFMAILVTDVVDPQGVFDYLKQHISENKLLSIPALCIVRKRVSMAGSDC
jgi:DNA-binding MarR family transcriptional regulator